VFQKVLKLLREKIRTRQYIMTLHAEEEMDDEGLTVYDIENAIMSGNLVERQKDKPSSEWKYRISGKALSGEEVEVIAKIGRTGKAVIITIYSV